MKPNVLTSVLPNLFVSWFLTVRGSRMKRTVLALTVSGGKANICRGFIDLWVIRHSLFTYFV